jgi:hypothetical protein
MAAVLLDKQEHVQPYKGELAGIQGSVGYTSMPHLVEKRERERVQR